MGAFSVRGVPALGPLLDPANGIWHVAANAELPRDSRATIPGLTAPVRVVYDDRAVPHIFAATEADAERALGYVVARDRLFQLELHAHAGAGTLTEMLGRPALPFDRRMRGLGLPLSAEWKLATADSRQSASGLSAFSDGVNAYISHLAPRDYPFEDKLLSRAPAAWLPINSIHLFNNMTLDLSYNDDEIVNYAVRERVGRAAADALFPVNSPVQEPIQVSDRPEPRTDFHVIPPPGKPEPPLARVAEFKPPNEDLVIGSNNWAVSPRRTHDGHAILAGDPHLTLSLPSIWYEAHLVVPGALDVYGVTIPGAPSIIIGFNRDVAWTFTNVSGDFVDRYFETVDDTAHPTKYMVDGKWRPLVTRTESYRDQHGAVIATDTTYWTHRGPMRRALGRWISTRWTANDSSLNSVFFEQAAHARSVAEFMATMAAYRSPPQNMLAADRAGSIGIRSTGAYPIRPGDGRGDLMRDGSTSKSDWMGYLPLAKYPQSMDPARGYLSSNNQQPVDPANNAHYLGSDWPPPWRAIRINELMRADANVTMDDMRKWQTDPRSARAELFVPAFIAAAHARVNSDPVLARAGEVLAEWDRAYTASDQHAILFEYAMEELSNRTWDELRTGAASDADLPTPSGSVLAELLQQPKSVWWDDKRTPKVETRDDILAASLAAAYVRAVRDYGEPDEGGWRWGRLRHANIYHMLEIPALSALLVPSQGGPSTLNPVGTDGRHGASWRMVVEMGPAVHAMATYPGGQSGNPASSRYQDHLVTWSKGELDSVRFPHSELELDHRLVTATLTLTPAPK